MKKYPFSKKAVTAILAATVAFSPVVSFGGVFEEQTVEAASTDAISRVTTIYSHLGETATGLFNEAAEGLKGFTKEDWEEVLTSDVFDKINTELQELQTTDYNTLGAEDIAGKITLLVYNSTATNIGAQLDAFKTSDEGGAFEAIVGEDSIDLIVQFLVDTEKKLWSPDRLTQLQNGTSVDDIAAEIRDELIEANPLTYGKLNDNLYTKMGTNLEGLISIKDSINDKLVDKTDLESTEITTLRNAFVLAAFLAGNPNGGGGGGGGVIPPIEEPTPGEGEVEVPTESVTEGSTVVTQVPAAKVAEIVSQITAEKAIIPVTLETPAAGETVKAQIPADLFTKAAEQNKAAAVNVKTAEASYELPVSEINVTELANELGVAAADVKIEISVNVVPQSEVKADLDNNNLNAVSDVIEFTVNAVSGDKEVSISKFSTYVKRTITGNKAFNADRTAAVKLVNGKFQAAPATFKDKEATIYKRDNSKYVIVENDKTFDDVNNGKNFAEATIEKLASKYIIFGKSETEFAHTAAITRGEFAALISRSLGLVAENPTEVKFPDTPTTKAVNQNGEINAVAEAGIINGYGDGNFQPDKAINRAEAAIMLSKALDYVNVAESKYTTSKKLADFKDDAVIGTTSRQYVEKVYQAGLISGFSDKTFRPDNSMQRDQMAVVLEKLLQTANLID